MSETKDDREFRILELLCDMWNPKALLDLIDSEYLRGRTDERKEIMDRIAGLTKAPEVKLIEKQAPIEQVVTEVTAVAPTTDEVVVPIKEALPVPKKVGRPPNPKPATPPRAMQARDQYAPVAAFEHGGESINFSPAQHRIAVKLKAAMGKGFLDFKFLSQAGLQRIIPDAERWCLDTIKEMNPLLARVGLVIKYTPKFGCEMKEL